MTLLFEFDLPPVAIPYLRNLSLITRIHADMALGGHELFAKNQKYLREKNFKEYNPALHILH